MLSNQRPSAWLVSAVAFAVAPTIIFAHELGHYFSSLALGLHPKLYALSVVTGAFRPKHIAITTASGPLIEFLSCFAGICLLIHSRKGRPNSPFPVSQWVYFIMSLASLRWVVQPLVSLIPSHGPLLGLGDERTLSAVLGLPHQTIPLISIFFAVSALAFSLSLHPHGERLRAFVITVPAMAAGTALWVIILGPLTFGLTPRSTRTLSARPTSTSHVMEFTSSLSILPPAGPVNFFR